MTPLPKQSHMHARLGRWFGGVVAAGVVLLTTGCTVYSPAQRDEGEPDETLAAPPALMTSADWPARNLSDLSASVASTPREISWWRLDDSMTSPPSDYAQRLRERLTRPEALVSYAGIHGNGIIRVLESPQSAARMARGAQQTGRAFAPIRFVSMSPLANRPMDERQRQFKRWLDRSIESERRSESRFADAGVCLNDPKIVSMLWEGTGMRIIPPAVAPGAEGEAGPGRGLIIHMPGLGSMEYEQPVLDELSARGWWILRIATPRFWWFEDTKFEINSESDVSEAAKRIAAIVDDLLAEPAYAAEAALDYLRSQRPEVPTRPLMLVGMSAGALVMPAVAARIHEQVDGMMLVGGGANLLRISQESDLTDGGLRITFNPPSGTPTSVWRERLFAEYLAASRMDPYYTASAVRDRSTLLVLAGMDSTVPSSAGRLLWERLDRPERLVHSFGHALLFWSLSSQKSRIADWIDGVWARSSGGPGQGPGLGSPR